MKTSGAETMRPALLLLDLDGVLVFEHGPPWLEQLEILRLHSTISIFLRQLAIPVVVLTHRSRAEARRILQAAELDAGVLTGVMAAEDLAISAFRHGAVRRLFGKGLRKSLILPEIERRYGIVRANMAMLDDRLDNLDDLLGNGLGFALHAPSGVIADGGLITFDIGDVVAAFSRWRTGHPGPRLVTLPPRRLKMADFARTGLSTKREGNHGFNHLRDAARKVRRSIEAFIR